MKKVLTGVLALLAISSMAMAEEAKSLEDRVAELEKEMAGVKTASGFEFHGYARSGLLVSDSLKEGSAFNKNGVGRLGNEDDSYLETELVKGFTGDNGAWAKYHVMFASGASSKTSWNSDTNPVVRQGFVEMGNLSELKGSLSTATFWAGKRFYGRDDIHITDNYWRDMSGTGAGVQGIKMGDKTLDVAVIGTDGEGDVLPLTLDARVNMPNDLQVELALHSANGNSDLNSDRAEMGLQLAAVKGLKGFYGSGDGFSKAAVQFGMDMGASLGDAQWGNAGHNEGDMALRGLTYGLKSMGNANLMTEAVLNFNMPDGEDTVMGLSLAGRYMKPVNKNLSMQYEAGLFLSNEENNDGMDIKLTAAPTLALNDSFWGRPQLRVFGSILMATGDRKVVADDEMDLRAGVQMEAWW